MPTENQKPSAAPYVFAGLSFIPGIGIVIGIAVCIWGLLSKSPVGRRVAAIGVGGVAFSVILYSALFYFGFVQRGGVYDDLRAKLATSTLTNLVQAIEFYKLQNGHYPESLEVLRASLPKDSLVFVFDPSVTQFAGQPRYFHYELLDAQHYYLRGVGPDETPFTADDILPSVSGGATGNIGLTLEKVGS